MRRILVENARHRRRLRHGGGHKRLDLDQVELGVEPVTQDLVALDEALQNLSEKRTGGRGGRQTPLFCRAFHRPICRSTGYFGADGQSPLGVRESLAFPGAE